MKILIKIAFKGTAYKGYQVQGSTPTIQRELNTAANDLFGFNCDITGCSRTDSGVHAKCFCATITKHNSDSIVTTIPQERIPRAMNIRLPEDISVLDAVFVEDDFHPRYSVISKTYTYLIDNSKERDPFTVDTAYHFPRPLAGNATELMNEAAALIVGKHDFSSFMAAGSKIVDATRTVSACSVTKTGNLIAVTITADGFLYNMVRIVAGTLLDIGCLRMSPDEIISIIEAKERSVAGSTLPACGLCLTDVKYPVDYFLNY